MIKITIITLLPKFRMFIMFTNEPRNTYNTQNIAQKHNKNLHDFGHANTIGHSLEFHQMNTYPSVVHQSSKVTNDFYKSELFKYTPQTSVANTAYNYQNNTKNSYGYNITQPTVVHSIPKSNPYDDYYFLSEQKVQNLGNNFQPTSSSNVSHQHQAQTYDNTFTNKPIINSKQRYQQPPTV